MPIVRGQNNTAAGILNAIAGGNEQQAVTLGGFNATTQSFQVAVDGINSAVLGLGGLALTNANLATAINGIAGFAGTVTATGAGNTGFTADVRRRLGQRRRPGDLDRQLHRRLHLDRP